jgi:hypothetical protein
VQLGSSDDEEGVFAGELDSVSLARVVLNLGEKLFFGDAEHLVAAIAADCLVGRVHRYDNDEGGKERGNFLGRAR